MPGGNRGQGLGDRRNEPGVPGDGLQRGPQHERQAHHRDVIIERRQGLPNRNHRVRAPSVLEQTLQRSLAFEDDLPGLRSRPGRKADELDDIAEALLGTDQ